MGRIRYRGGIRPTGHFCPEMEETDHGLRVRRHRVRRVYIPVSHSPPLQRPRTRRWLRRALLFAMALGLAATLLVTAAGLLRIVFESRWQKLEQCMARPRSGPATERACASALDEVRALPIIPPVVPDRTRVLDVMEAEVGP